MSFKSHVAFYHIVLNEVLPEQTVLFSLQSGIENWSNMDGIMNSHWFSFFILIKTCYLWSNMDKRKLSIYRGSPHKNPIYLNPYSIIWMRMKHSSKNIWMKHSSKKTTKQVCLRLIYYEISILNGWLEIINFKV